MVRILLGNDGSEEFFDDIRFLLCVIRQEMDAWHRLHIELHIEHLLDTGELFGKSFHGIILFRLGKYAYGDLRMSEISRRFYFADRDEYALFETYFFPKDLPEFRTEELIDLVDARMCHKMPYYSVHTRNPCLPW